LNSKIENYNLYKFSKVNAFKFIPKKVFWTPSVENNDQKAGCRKHLLQR
jgi:hypothetical protein